MKLSDYIAQALVDAGITEVFSVVGGASMHLNDSLAKHPGLRVTYCAHENSCVTAAESYFRLTGKLAAVVVTSGPGSLNCVTGVHGAYCDSMGLVVISGQCDSRTINYDLRLRQLGDQECDIVSIVAPITKRVREVTATSVRQDVVVALYLASHGRPGPTWLVVPVDVQALEIDPEALAHHTMEAWEVALPPVSAETYEKLWRMLNAAKRPVILAGSGIRTSGAVDEFLDLVDYLAMPVVTAYNGHDLLPSDHPDYVGRQGTIGDIAGNLAVQESDFLLILGSRMNIRSVGFNWDAFAPKAYKVQVDIDAAELHKPFPMIDLGIHADLKVFCRAMMEESHPAPVSSIEPYILWYDQCKAWQAKYPVVKPEYHDAPILNPYVFVEQLFDLLREDDIIVTANGTACVATFQAAKIKEGQRLYTNGGSSAMGWAIGAAIGAARGAIPGQRVILIEGDGSLQMSVGDLATIEHNKLLIIIFVLNNNGYVSIRQTQDRFFSGHYSGIGPATGVGFPDFLTLAGAYGMRYELVFEEYQLAKALEEWPGPTLCEVCINPAQPFAPRIRFPMEVEK